MVTFSRFTIMAGCLRRVGRQAVGTGVPKKKKKKLNSKQLVAYWQQGRCCPVVPHCYNYKKDVDSIPHVDVDVADLLRCLRLEDGGAALLLASHGVDGVRQRPSGGPSWG